MPVILWNFALLKAGRAQLSTAHTSWYLLWLPPRPVLPSSAPPPGLLIWELPQELEDIHTSEYLTQGYERISFWIWKDIIIRYARKSQTYPLKSSLRLNPSFDIQNDIQLRILLYPYTYPLMSIYLSMRIHLLILLHSMASWASQLRPTSPPGGVLRSILPLEYVLASRYATTTGRSGMGDLWDYTGRAPQRWP